jgi:hypothetical protein
MCVFVAIIERRVYPQYPNRVEWRIRWLQTRRAETAVRISESSLECGVGKHLLSYVDPDQFRAYFASLLGKLEDSGIQRARQRGVIQCDYRSGL